MAKEAKAKKKSARYEVAGGNVKRSGKFCPKCGDGVLLAKHKNRVTCGRCHYMEKV
jgi:ubiquitin-small subunit ribosomal protein S27Ae